MLIGVPKEIKNHEYRVGLTPSSVFELCKHGHSVIIEHTVLALIFLMINIVLPVLRLWTTQKTFLLVRK